jgi:hypothetical protein
MKTIALPDELIMALKRFDKEADVIVKSFLTPIDSIPVSNTIYHYTNGIGLKGILGSKIFWFTDAFHLNDPTEIRHGVNKALMVLDEAVDHFSADHQEFIRNFRSFCLSGPDKVAQYFAFSFSTEPDDLNQWRGYADNGRGYCLGFDGAILEHIFTTCEGERVASNSTFFVNYDDLTITRIQEAIISKMLPLISMPRKFNLPKKEEMFFNKQLSALLSLHALRASLTFKNQAYKSESEFRFFQLHSYNTVLPNVGHRQLNGNLVRYLDFDWGSHPEALKSIRIGPAANADEASIFAKAVLRNSRFGEVPILQSKVPYRA